mgnify:CR=1 FL=1
MHGDPLMEVTDAMPEDVVLLKAALDRLRLQDRCANETLAAVGPLTLNVGNAGTAFRFLTAYCAQLQGCEVVLDGCERMRHRPIGPLVEALRTLGAKIDYVGEEGFPPLHIKGQKIHNAQCTMHNEVSSQFASALELIGVPCDAPASPYLTMTREVMRNHPQEKDWSSAAFWYEYVAIHGGEIELPGLRQDSLQGDRVVADIFQPLGVDTLYTNACVRIRGSIHHSHESGARSTIHIDFSSCPDLYPAVAMTCKVLGCRLQATGIENLRYKESDRIASVEAMLSTPQGQIVKTEHDHRIAMAAMVAGYKVDDEQCVAKSYPNFKRELCKLLSHVEA